MHHTVGIAHRDRGDLQRLAADFQDLPEDFSGRPGRRDAGTVEHGPTHLNRNAPAFIEQSTSDRSTWRLHLEGIFANLTPVPQVTGEDPQAVAALLYP